MNLMIPVFICTFPSMAVEEEQINRTPSFFITLSSGMSVIRYTDEAN